MEKKNLTFEEAKKIWENAPFNRAISMFYLKDTCKVLESTFSNKSALTKDEKEKRYYDYLENRLARQEEESEGSLINDLSYIFTFLKFNINLFPYFIFCYDNYFDDFEEILESYVEENFLEKMSRTEIAINLIDKIVKEYNIYNKEKELQELLIDIMDLKFFKNFTEQELQDFKQITLNEIEEFSIQDFNKWKNELYIKYNNIAITYDAVDCGYDNNYENNCTKIIIYFTVACDNKIQTFNYKMNNWF